MSISTSTPTTTGRRWVLTDAYTQYAKAAGLTPHMLDQFEQVEFPELFGDRSFSQRHHLRWGPTPIR